MTDDSNMQLRRAVSKTGFAFQLRVEKLVRDLPRESGWEVVGREVRWESFERDGEYGFVDLVIRKASLCFVVECKKRTGGEWVFLQPQGVYQPRRHVRCVAVLPRGTPVVHDFNLDPASVETDFCAVPGAGAGERSLERVAGELVAATTALAIAHAATEGRRGQQPVAFIPLIVSNLKPATCKFDVGTVSLENGDVRDEEIDHVSHVRFRKSFAGLAPGQDPSEYENLSALAVDQERTVLVVGATEFEQFLLEMWAANEESMFPAARPGGGS